MSERQTPEDDAPPNLLAAWYGARTVAAGKWVPAVLYALSVHGPLHFQNLNRIVSANITDPAWPHNHQKLHDSSLAATLRRLVDHGLIERQEDETDSFTASVRYQLTDAGTDLVRAAHALAEWGNRYIEIVARAHVNRHHRLPGR